MEEIERQIRERLDQNIFMQHNHMELESLERDRAVFRLDIHEDSKNPLGMVHGGALYALADNATGTAAHTDGREYVTQDGCLHFLRNQPAGSIRATAWVRHRGRATVLTEVDITGEGGKLLATGEFSFFCVDKDRIRAKARQAK